MIVFGQALTIHVCEFCHIVVIQLVGSLSLAERILLHKLVFDENWIQKRIEFSHGQGVKINEYFRPQRTLERNLG